MAKSLTTKEAVDFLSSCGFVPIDPYVNVAEPWKVKCKKCKNIFSLRLNNYRTRYKNSRPNGCPKCLTRPVRTATESALREMEDAGMEPLEPFIKVTSKWKYKCIKCQNINFTTLHAVRRGNRCPICAGAKVDLKVVSARMAAANLVPLEPYRSNTTKWKVKHLDCGNEVVTTWAEVQSGQGGCGICKYSKISKKLRTPEIDAVRIVEIAGGLPLEPYKNSHSRWKIKCLKCKQISHPMLSNINKGQGICIYCRPKSPVVTQENAMRFIASKNMKALASYRSAQSKWKLQCLICGKTDLYVYSWMKSQNYGCVYCSRHKVDPKDVHSKFWRMGFEPLEPYISARKGIKSRCLSCNKVYSKTFDSLQSGRGCKYCQTAALELLAPAYFYIIHHLDFGAFKIGIGNSSRRTDRIRAHTKEGWTLLYRYDLDTGETALELEQETLKWIRETLKLPTYLLKEQMPQGGWTETFDAEGISFVEVKEFFEKTLSAFYKKVCE